MMHVDRLVLTQDGEQRERNEWFFIKYDALNRPVLTGLHDTTVTLNRATMQTVVDTHYLRNPNSDHETLAGGVHGYTNSGYPVQDDERRYLSVTYYDDYNFTSAVPGFGLSYSYQRPVIPSDCQMTPQGTYCYETVPFDQVKGQVTGTKTRVLGTDHWTNAVMYYDERYRMIQTVSYNAYHNVTHRTSQVYNFPGWLFGAVQRTGYGCRSHRLTATLLI